MISVLSQNILAHNALFTKRPSEVDDSTDLEKIGISQVMVTRYIIKVLTCCCEINVRVDGQAGMCHFPVALLIKNN